MIVVRLDISPLLALKAKLKPEAAKIVAKAAYKAEGYAKAFAPVDTGALKNSIKAEESRGGGAGGNMLFTSQRFSTGGSQLVSYSLGKGSRSGFFGGGSSSVLWVIHDGPGRDGRLYGIYQEMGTYKMAAHPFFIPAIEKVEGELMDMFMGLFK